MDVISREGVVGGTGGIEGTRFRVLREQDRRWIPHRKEAAKRKLVEYVAQGGRCSSSSSSSTVRHRLMSAGAYQVAVPA